MFRPIAQYLLANDSSSLDWSWGRLLCKFQPSTIIRQLVSDRIFMPFAKLEITQIIHIVSQTFWGLGALMHYGLATEEKLGNRKNTCLLLQCQNIGVPILCFTRALFRLLRLFWAIFLLYFIVIFKWFFVTFESRQFGHDLIPINNTSVPF